VTTKIICCTYRLPYILVINEKYWVVERDYNLGHEYNANGHQCWHAVSVFEKETVSHQMRSMLIATICHDVDHRGRNNSFLQETKQPLSTLYKSSVMEQHHYATTIKILQVIRAS